MSGRLSLLVMGLVASVNAITKPAADVVGTDDNTLFEFETVQLTDESLSILDGDTAALFQFYNETDTSADIANRAVDACKVFPGDASWPSSRTWETLNVALGNNALIKTIPLAAPCYESWGYDQAECASLTTNWTNSYLQ